MMTRLQYLRYLRDMKFGKKLLAGLLGFDGDFFPIYQRGRHVPLNDGTREDQIRALFSQNQAATRSQRRNLRKFTMDEIVSKDGVIDMKNLKRCLQQMEAGTNHKYDSFRQRARRHQEDGTVILLHHLLRAATTAQHLPVPSGATRQEFVFAALMHDIGKIAETKDIAHGEIGAVLLKDHFKDVPKKVADAVSGHMSKRKLSGLQRAVRVADVGNGRTSIAEIKEMMGGTGYRYETPERIEIDDSTYKKPFAAVPEKDRRRRMNKFAKEAGVVDPILFEDARVIPTNIDEATGTFSIKTNERGEPLIEYHGQEYTQEELNRMMRKDLEKTKKLDQMRLIMSEGGTPKFGDLPIYKGTEIRELANRILSNKKLMAKIQRDIEREAAGGKGDRAGNAAHTLLNLKLAAKRDFEDLYLLGGYAAGTGKEYFRISPGQISTIVDEYKAGYRGIVTPVVKGSGNYLGRNEEGFAPAAHGDFGRKLYTSNSDKVAIRYADLRAFLQNDTWEALTRDLPNDKKVQVNKIRDKILAVNAQHRLQPKQGTTDYSYLQQGYRQGTFEDLPPELFEDEEYFTQMTSLYGELQNVLGDTFLGIGGVRRGILKIDPEIVIENWGNKRYQSTTPLDSIFRAFGVSRMDHNKYVTVGNQLGIKQMMTANIGESSKDAMDHGAPYGIDFMSRPQDFVVSKYKKGNKINYLDYIR